MMITVRKAVITAAGRGTRMYPATNTLQKELFPLVDVDGYAKPTLQIIIEELLASGIEEICIVVNPANAGPVQQYFHGLSPAQKAAQFAGKEWAMGLSDALDAMAERLTFVMQHTQEGYGHAVYQTRDWVGDEPFVLILGDHIYLTDTQERCTRQVIAVYEQFHCPVTSVGRTPVSIIHRYGIIAGQPLADRDLPVYEIKSMVEKPAIEYAHAHLRTPGLANDDYLAHFGIHIFTPAIFDCLEQLIREDTRDKNELQLTSAQQMLLKRGRYLACEVMGKRYDMGVPEGLIETQIALALRSPFAAQAREMVRELLPQRVQ